MKGETVPVAFWALMVAAATSAEVIPPADLVRRLTVVSGNPVLLDSRELCPAPPPPSRRPAIFATLVAGFAVATGASMVALDDSCGETPGEEPDCVLRDTGLVGAAIVAAAAGFVAFLYYSSQPRAVTPGYCTRDQLEELEGDYQTLLADWWAAHPEPAKPLPREPDAEQDYPISASIVPTKDPLVFIEATAVAGATASVVPKVLPGMPAGALDLGPIVGGGCFAKEATVMLFLAAQAERLRADGFVTSRSAVAGRLADRIALPDVGTAPDRPPETPSPIRPGVVRSFYFDYRAFRLVSGPIAPVPVDWSSVEPGLGAAFAEARDLQEQLNTAASLLASQIITARTYERVRSVLLGAPIPEWAGSP